MLRTPLKVKELYTYEVGHGSYNFPSFNFIFAAFNSKGVFLSWRFTHYSRPRRTPALLPKRMQCIFIYSQPCLEQWSPVLSPTINPRVVQRLSIFYLLFIYWMCNAIGPTFRLPPQTLVQLQDWWHRLRHNGFYVPRISALRYSDVRDPKVSTTKG